jgi:hypothetical protein
VPFLQACHLNSGVYPEDFILFMLIFLDANCKYSVLQNLGDSIRLSEVCLGAITEKNEKSGKNA